MTLGPLHNKIEGKAASMEGRVKSILQRAFRVYPEEWKLLMWVTLIQLTMRVSSVLVNNYSQTTFLKRFGVENLPTVFVVESVLTFLVINAVGMLMSRFSTLPVFSALLLFFGASVGAIRLLIPLDIPVLYAILFILKSQAIETLPILYWDLLNDLFTTRQSKRLFTLVTAGGILGTTVGSIMTGKVAKWIGVDNVLWVFVVGMVVAATLNSSTQLVLGAPIEPRTEKARKRPRHGLKTTLKEALAYSKESPFLIYMVLLVGVPNLVLPILTYQFNVVVDITYGTEQETLNFLGIFRGASNAFIFAALLFSGRILSRWGIPNSLLVHPINYLLAFSVLLFRFDILSAIYARFTTETFKTTLNNPARAVLYNFFPQRMRSLVRVFLRGTVVRAADLAGSGLLMAIRGVVEPRLLSLVAIPFVAVWVLTSFLVKRNYPRMLVKVLLEKQIDWERLEAVDAKTLAGDELSISALRRGLREGNEEVVLLCAEVLSYIKPPGWKEEILEVLPQKSQGTRERLLDLIMKEAREDELFPVLMELAKSEDPTLVALALHGIRRMNPLMGRELFQGLLDHPNREIRVGAMAGILHGNDEDSRAMCQERLRAHLLSQDPGKVTEALEILSISAEPSLSEEIRKWIHSEDPHIRALALKALSTSCGDEILKMAESALEDHEPEVRRAAAMMMSSCGPKVPIEKWIQLLADEDAQVRAIAKEALKGYSHYGKELIGYLASPSRTTREEVLALLAELEAKPHEISQFVSLHIRRAYELLVLGYEVTRRDGQSLPAMYLKRHLIESSEGIQETILRVIAAQGGEEGMPILLRALGSKDKREVDNALEALESFLHPGLRKILVPLIEPTSLEEKVQFARRRFKGMVQVSSGEELPLRLIREEDPVTVALGIYYAGELGLEAEKILRNLASSQGDHPFVLEALSRFQAREEAKEKGVYPRLDLLQRAHLVAQVPIFSAMLVKDLMAVASIILERSCGPEEVVVREGEPGDALYLVVEGRFIVLKAAQEGGLVPLDWIGPGGFFGEMALFDRGPRSATVISEDQGLLLKLDGQSFTSLMERVPTIPIRVCAELSKRIRTVHGILLGQKAHQ